jgi:hypothetical protein
MKPTNKRPALPTGIVGGRVLVFYDPFLRAINIDPETEGPDRPKTITIQQAQKLSNLSARTINRMIADGRAVAETTQENAA